MGPNDLFDLPGVGIGGPYSAQAPLTVVGGATLLTHAGDDHQLQVNKAAAADTASLLFQTDFSGRAEMGTAGSDDFSLKVSADGSTWHDGLAVNRMNGRVNLPNGLTVTGALTLPAASVTRAALADSTALSVIGRSANSAGVPADIAAASDHQVLRRSGSALGFGAVALNQAAAVSGQLPIANGGTGGTTAAAARTALGLDDAVNAYRRGNILGTVSESGGVPTGAIIQRGSNSNGRFVRFADGTQICTREIDYDTGGTTSAINYAFPADFSPSRADYVGCSIRYALGGGDLVARRYLAGRISESVSVTNSGFWQIRGEGYSGGDIGLLSFSLYAFGRWF